MEDNYQKEEKEIEEVEGDNLPNPLYQEGKIHPVQLGKGHKIAVFALAVFAILAIWMWGMQFKNNVTQPFSYNNNIGIQNSVPQQEEDDEEMLRNKDTDEDGLSDWDELYLYKTSPYLQDSDSDGFNDQEEINNEKDPNCPAGRDCYSLVMPIVNDGTGDLLNQLEVNNENQDSESELQSMLEGQSDADSLRKMLLDAGMDKEILNQISDEDLLKSYQDTLNK